MLNVLFEVAMAIAVMVAIGTFAFAVVTGRLEMRPFRTSGLLLALILIGALWLTFHYDVSGIVEDPYARGFVDGSIVMAVLTGLVTAINRVFDDGGESDAVKIVRDFLNKNN